MKETTFIEQNKEKWKRFEELSKKGDADPDELSELFVQITDDLAYARTHYPKRSVRVYLNQLAQGVYTDLHKGRKYSLKQVMHFFTHSLPLEMYRMRKQLLLSFLIILLGGVIGIISTADDKDFFGVIMGEGYVYVTDQNIEDADPMGIYKDTDSTLMFLEIMWNNLRVSFLYYVLGILFGVGTMLMILYTGIMVGSFHYYMYLSGYLGITLQTVWMHGTLEISAIVIAGAAGVVLGNGVMFPGSFKRGVSLRLAARRSLKVMIGLIPVLMLAAFIEGYVTRQTEMDYWLKAIVIFGSLAFVLGYFVIYPLVRFWKFDDSKLEESPSVLPEREVKIHKSRSTGELFTGAFSLVRRSFKFFKRSLLPIFFLHVLFIIGVVMFGDFDFNRSYTWPELLAGIFGTKEKMNFILIGINALFISLYSTSILTGYKMHKEDLPASSYGKTFMKEIGRTWIIQFSLTVLITLFIIAIYNFGYILLFGIMPILLVPAFTLGLGKGVMGEFGKGFSMAFKGYGQGFVLFLAMMAMVFFGFSLLHPPGLGFENSPLIGMIEQFVEWHTVTQTSQTETIINVIRLVVYIGFLYFLIPAFLMGFGLHYFSVREKEEATGLYERMEKFGEEDRVFET